MMLGPHSLPGSGGGRGRIGVKRTLDPLRCERFGKILSLNHIQCIF